MKLKMTLACLLSASLIAGALAVSVAAAENDTLTLGVEDAVIVNDGVESKGSDLTYEGAGDPPYRISNEGYKSVWIFENNDTNKITFNFKDVPEGVYEVYVTAISLGSRALKVSVNGAAPITGSFGTGSDWGRNDVGELTPEAVPAGDANATFTLKGAVAVVITGAGEGNPGPGVVSVSLVKVGDAEKPDDGKKPDDDKKPDDGKKPTTTPDKPDDKPGESPKTGSASVVIAAVAVISLAGVVVAAKKREQD